MKKNPTVEYLLFAINQNCFLAIINIMLYYRQFIYSICTCFNFIYNVLSYITILWNKCQKPTICI